MAPAVRPGVEGEAGAIGSLVPAEERPGGHLQVAGQVDAPEYLDGVAPRHGHGPAPAPVVADGLL